MHNQLLISASGGLQLVAPIQSQELDLADSHAIPLVF